MVVGTTKNVVNNISFSLKKIIKDITGLRVISTVGKGANKSLNNLGKFVGKVPLGGKVIGYVFKQSGKGVVIVATTSYNLILAPLPTILAIFIWIIIVKLSKLSSLGALCSIFLLTIYELIFIYGNLNKGIIFTIFLLIFLKHYSNIKRLIKGEENKINL